MPEEHSEGEVEGNATDGFAANQNEKKHALRNPGEELIHWWPIAVPAEELEVVVQEIPAKTNKGDIDEQYEWRIRLKARREKPSDN